METLGNVRDVCRQHNIAEQTVYRWRRQCDSMDVADTKRLVGNLTLDNRMLKDVVGKKW